VPSIEAFEVRSGERTLFASSDPNIIVFLDFASIEEAEFLSLLVSASPKHIIDLRAVPRFDTGNLNRKLVFSVFKNAGSVYHDLGAIIGAARMREIVGMPLLLAKAVLESVFHSGEPLVGPAVLLIDTRQASSEFIDAFASTLDAVNPQGWQILRVPSVSRSSAVRGRTIVFISHATPDDNPFASWLTTQLSLSGYEVWADFDRLEGGELFWDTIEDVIRNRAAKVVVAASGLAQTRPGVLDEIALALSVERSLGLSNFVIPLRIDETPYGDFRANIARRNIIDFHGNWAAGLGSVLKALEADGVSMEPRTSERDLGKLIQERLRLKKELLAIPDPVSVNWIQVTQWPSAIHALSLSVPAHRVSAQSKVADFPNVQFADLLISFASAATFSTGLSGVGASSAGSVATSEFLRGRWSQLPSLRPHIAQRMMSNLLRQAWERFARSRGLIPFALASGTNCWFFANGRIEGNKVSFRDELGKKRTKALVGFSQKRSVYWHFAAELKPLPNHPDKLVVKPHVVFSEDGTTPLESAARMHALRRGFCKSWWNDRWRDLIVAFLTHLSDENGEISFGTGGSAIVLTGSMDRYECPVSPDERDAPVDDSNPAAEEDEDDPEIDEEEIGYALRGDQPEDVP
jgi:hypothetical protein